MRYRYPVELSGKVAAVGGRLIRGAARQLIDRFLRALVREAGGGDGGARPGRRSGGDDSGGWSGGRK